ncbi:MAG: protein kinase [Ardenticatenaceae bacterium]|nr:protein kinase [Ardenticatenaceae bacterium]MCB9004644.1 protein kinase [Ardenticatenaceae bacterium]
MQIHHHHHHDNPFFNRHRITDPAYFFGREREIEALYSAIATRQCRSIVGERKMGKSSLLSHLADPATLQHHGFNPEQYVFVYIDLEGMANITYDEFWPEVLDRMEMALPEQASNLRDMVADMALQSEVRFMQVRRLLRRVDRAGLTVVLMLDEFESLASNVAFNASFYGELRSLAGEIGVVYITASKRSLYDLTYQHADTLSSPFFNIFSEEPLGLLPHKEAVLLLGKLALRGQEPRPFTPTQIEEMIRLAGPHPFFLQLAGYYLYAHENGQADDTVPDKVKRRFIAEAEDHFRYVWSQLTPLEQDALQHLPTISPEMKKGLLARALLSEDEQERLRPFSTTFADFLNRNQVSERPANGRSGTNTSTTDLSGTTLGSYRVLTAVGRGGMAVVYKGYQPSLDRYVAIKVMSHNLAGDHIFIERFQREAASVAQLRHHNIVQMYDFDIHEDISYMVMEYIEGQTLKERLLDLHQQQQRLSITETVQIISNIAAALDYAHAYNIVHRDIKPANIMLRREEKLAQLTGVSPFVAVLTDFGVARMLEGMQLTGTGATIGTPDYMSPEQARGDAAGPTSDVYALGILLYEMLTGELPFTADTPIAVLLKHMQADPPSVLQKVPDLPTGLETVLMRSLTKTPHDRFPTAGQMAQALQEATGLPV